MLDTDKEIGEGFRPTDTELIHYLKLMLQGNHSPKIPVVDIYKYEPSDLPGEYFFCPRHDENRSRTSRLTKEGFWKSTGQDRVIKDEARRPTSFKKKSLVYYGGRSRRSDRTNWVIHEIRAILDDGKTTQGGYVLCKVIKKPDKNVNVSTDNEGEPSNTIAHKNNHLSTKENSEFSAPTSCKRKFDGPLSTFEHSRSSSYRQANNVEDEPIHAMNFETLYLSLHGGNNASCTTTLEEVMVGQQSDVSLIDYRKQCYGLNPIPEVDQPLVFKYGRSANVEDKPIHEMDFKILYLSSHSGNNASYTTTPEEVMVGQQTDVSLTGYDKQCYSLDLIPEVDHHSVFDYGRSDNVEDEPIHETDFETSYVSLHGGNNASYTTTPEEVMVGQQSDVSLISYKKQCYGLNPIPEVDQPLVFDYCQSDNVEDEPIHETDFETSYLSWHDENNASYTTTPEEVMVGQQSDISLTGYNKQCYGLNPIPEVDHHSVLDYGRSNNVEDEPIHEMNFKTLYLSSHGGNNASYTTTPEEVMVGQQSDVSLTGYNTQCYGLNPIPEVDQPSVFDYGRSDNVEDEPIHETDFETSYLSSHGGNNASYTTIPEEVMVGQQSDVSLTGYNTQCYGLNPIPKVDQPSVFDYGRSNNVEDEPIDETDFKTSYLSSHGGNNASYTTTPEEVMVGQQSDVSFIDYNKQCYILNPIPGSSVTPDFDELSVLVFGTSGFSAEQRWMT